VKASFEETRTVPVLTYLFTLRSINTSTLGFLRKVYPDRKYEEYMMDLIDYDGSPDVVDACQRLIDPQVFGEQPHSVYEFLYDLTTDQQEEEGFPNLAVRNFLRLKVEETAPALPAPTWVKDFGWLEREGRLPYEDELEVPDMAATLFPIPPAEEVVDILTAGLDKLGISTEEIEANRDALVRRLTVATNSEKIALLKPIWGGQAAYDRGADDTLFRIYGPANPIYNLDLNPDYSLQDSPCHQHGGCRMFTCFEFENYDDDIGFIDEEVDDHLDSNPIVWFRGACDYCHAKIANKVYAVRKPQPQGGWKGCYCSWEHVKADINSPEPATIPIINHIEETMLAIGIQDRAYRD
jgi:hypothetical protein